MERGTPRDSSAADSSETAAVKATISAESAIDLLMAEVTASLAQGDRLERTHDVVRSFRGEKAFVITGAEVPVVASVVRVAVKTPDSIHDDDRADPVVPKLAEIMKTQVCPRGSAF